MEVDKMEELIHKAWDVEIGHDGTDCRVSPIDFEAENGDEVRFHNLTDKDAYVVFSEDELFATDKIKVKAGKVEPLPVKVLLPQSGAKKTYPYAVYCKKTDDFALAGSMPIIIIVRK
jgi:hypothetical protein